MTARAQKSPSRGPDDESIQVDQQSAVMDTSISQKMRSAVTGSVLTALLGQSSSVTLVWCKSKTTQQNKTNTPSDTP